MVGNLPANAGDTGSCPGLGGSHMPRSGWARELQLLSLHVWSLCSTTREAATVKGPRTAIKEKKNKKLNNLNSFSYVSPKATCTCSKKRVFTTIII